MVLTLFSVCFTQGPNYFIPQQYNHAIIPQGGKRDTFPGLINSNKHEMHATGMHSSRRSTDVPATRCHYWGVCPTP